jgi:hypothetical protein
MTHDVADPVTVAQPIAPPASPSPPLVERGPGGEATRRILLSAGPGGNLRLTLTGDRCFPRVRVVQAAPLADPLRYISFLDEKGNEIATVADLGEFDAESRQLARVALDRFYVIAEIRQIRATRLEMGVSYWEVETDRGPRAFTLKDPQENVRDLGPGRILLIDAHGNRYQIPDVRGLDPASRKALEAVL